METTEIKTRHRKLVITEPFKLVLVLALGSWLALRLFSLPLILAGL